MNAATTKPIKRTKPTKPSQNKSFVLFGGILAFIVAAGVTAILMSRGSSTDTTATEVAAVTVTGAALPPAPETPGAVDPAVGLVAPSFEGLSTDGTAQTIAAKPGRRLMIVVVAHWCPHCQRELPRLVQWQQAGSIPADLDVAVLSTSVAETAGNYPPSAWLTREKNPFPVLVDDADKSALRALGGMGFPNMHLIGTDGKVIARTSGELETPALEAFANQTAA